MGLIGSLARTVSLVFMSRKARTPRKLALFAWDTLHGGHVSYRVGPLFRRMCSALCNSFHCRVSGSNPTRAIGQIRIGIIILPPSKVLAHSAVVEVCTSKLAL